MNASPLDGTGASRGSLKSYGIGFLIAVVLTGFSFWLVMGDVVSGPTVLYWIYGAAALQILVHLHYFLHLDTSSAARWNVMAMLLTLIIMVLFVGGTLWIMFHLKERLM